MHFPDLAGGHAPAAATLADCPAERPPLIAFTPWRWHVDHQRPQQLLTRLARHYRVIVVEPPVGTHAEPHLASASPAPGVELLVPHTGSDAPGFHAEQLAPLQALLAAFVQERKIVAPACWLATPLALPLAERLAPRALMYDCMEDRPDWRAHEAALLARADVVVAAGPALYQRLRGRHANVHCMPNAVDARHFAAPPLAGSSIEAVSARALHAAIPGPRLGWFGAIDERFDRALLADVAARRPDWQFVLAGPVVGIDPASLPRRANLHWLGPQTHAILPHLQAHWDACILPLRPDACLHAASPRQTLEYLAGQKSVISTPVHDVVALHGHIVRLAADATSFVEACRAALVERGPLRRQRRIDALIAVHGSSWDRSVERIHRLLVECARGVEADPGAPAHRSAPPELVAAGASRAMALRYALG